LRREVVVNWIAFAIAALCVLMAVLPPRYDPAIRLREWIEREKRRR
jgi:hypothetical protein